jgi:hypothetical protein
MKICFQKHVSTGRRLYNVTSEGICDTLFFFAESVHKLVCEKEKERGKERERKKIEKESEREERRVSVLTSNSLDLF